MGIFDNLFSEEDPPNFGSPGQSIETTGRAIGGILGNIVNNRGSSSATAQETASSPEDDNERWRQSLIGDQQRKAEAARIQREYGPQPEEMPETAEDKARLGLLNVQISNAELQRDKLQDDIRQASSPEAKEMLRTQLATAQATLRRAELELSKSLTEMSPEEQMRLRDELDTRRERLKQELASAQSDKDYARILEREELAFSRQTSRDDRQFGRDLQRDQLSAGVTVRGQELQRLKAQDDFVMNMLQNQIAAGRLSLDKAAKQFEAYVTKARLPSEIMSNVSRAVEPLLPYMTSAKAGDIPLGFEKGGTRDIIGRLGGNSPSAHNPSNYAVKPVTVDPFQLAKQAGADFSSTKVPDPGKAFSGIGVPSVPSGGTSATAGIGPLSQFTGDIAAQQRSMGALGGASPMPPGVSPTAAESQELMKALGG